MPGILHFETFLLTGIVLNLTPGNDTIFILGRSMALGQKAGIISALGIGTGSLVHTVFAAFGLSAIIAGSVLLFNLVKYAGAAYLVYMGIQMVINKSRIRLEPDISSTVVQFKKIYRDAVLTNILNPKVALFFIAFLPQFIDAGSQQTILPFLILGITFTITGTAWCILLALFSSAIFAGLRNNQNFSSYLSKISGLILIGLGIKVAMTGRK